MLCLKNIHSFMAKYIFGLFVLFPVVLLGETITYENNSGYPLQNTGDFFDVGNGIPEAPNSLFSNSSRYGNTVNVISSTISTPAGTVGGSVYGGIGDNVSSTAPTSGNNVFITGGAVNAITGGLAADVDSIGNSVEIMGGATIRGIVYGGRVVSGSNVAGTGNSVHIGGNSTIRGNIYGAYFSGSGEVADNSVVLDSATYRGEIITAAYSTPTGTTAVSNNVVTINSGSNIISANIYGGRGQGSASDPATIIDNMVVVNGGEINMGSSAQRGIYGGQNVQGNGAHVTSNDVIIKGGNINADVYGGHINRGIGEVLENQVSISGENTNITGNIYGGYTVNGNDPAQISNNKVQISGGNINEGASEKKAIYGGYSLNGSGTHVVLNEVTISGGNINADVYGGHTLDGAGNVEQNKVTISGNNTKVTGDVYGGHAFSDSASENEVNLYGATIEGDIYGGHVSTSSMARENSVNLYGGTVTGIVHGTNDMAYFTTGDMLTVHSGLTNVGGINNFQYSDIKSGASLNVVGSDLYAGNFFNLTNNGFLSFYNNASNQGVARIGNYDGAGEIGLEVLLSESGSENDADSIVFWGEANAPVLLTFKVLEGSTPSPLVQKVRITTDEYNNNINFTTTDSGYGIYAYKIEQIGNEYFLSLTDKHVEDMGGGYTKMRTAGLSQLAFTVLRNGLESAISTVDEKGFGISADVGYSTQRFDTSGNTELEGASGLITLAYNKMGSPLAFSVFAEAFDGEYETSDIVEVPTGSFYTRSGGDLKSYGGGLSVQYREHLAEAIQSGNFTQFSRGLHLEAIARAGRSEVDYQEYGSGKSKFDMSGMYYGGTFGAGYVFANDSGLAVDIYGRAVWISMSEDDVTDNLGQKINYDRADSLRAIYGFSLGYMPSGYARYYFGAAVDWELLGEAEAAVDGYRVKGEDMSGESALFEIGANWRAGESVFIDLRAAGSIGMREGYGGLFEIKYVF